MGVDPGIVLETAEQTGETGAAAEAAHLEDAKAHSTTLWPRKHENTKKNL